ncbi:MAG: ribbon-helix-helix protein, CopG family [Coriobacteriia bacterium]|nr:ribbon-helix-helix protein, CopG family [Coriobacteriia bacterium]
MAKVNVYIPDDLLEHVDADALALGRSRSSIVQEALAEYVTSRAGDKRRAGVERAIAIADEVAAMWADNDMMPEVSASEFLIGLRHAPDGASDAEVILRIIEERSGGSDA